MSFQYPMVLTVPRQLTESEINEVLSHIAPILGEKIAEVVGRPLNVFGGFSVDFDNPVTVNPNCMDCVYGEAHLHTATYVTCNNNTAKAVLHDGSDGDDWPVDFNAVNVATCTGYKEKVSE